ncbi:hypothetical protein FRX31_029770, partial [Thalictrum thalictroides]
MKQIGEIEGKLCRAHETNGKTQENGSKVEDKDTKESSSQANEVETCETEAPDEVGDLIHL